MAEVRERDDLLSQVFSAEILWVRLRHRIDAEVMAAAPHLRAIATATTGLNHIDLEQAQRRGIRVISLCGQTDFLRHIYATAEHTLALLLSLIRRLPAAAEHVLNGGWNRDLFVGRELHGKTAGIVGYGRVGRMVAGHLGAFGMRVQVADPLIEQQVLDPGVEIASLDRLLKTSDVVSLHVALNQQTRGFFGAPEFALMKPQSWFINTSRGELIDESALLQALQTGRLSGAAVDVLGGEQSSGMAAHALTQYARSHDHLLITPHIAGCTIESTEKTENFIAEKIAEFLQGRCEQTATAAGTRKDRS